MTLHVDRFGLHGALHVVADVIGWDGIAAAAGCHPRAARRWADEREGRSPTLIAAAAIDRAYIAAGGATAPLTDALRAMTEAALAPLAPCATALAGDLAIASREAGEAVSAGIFAIDASASTRTLRTALVEVSEASVAFELAERRLAVLVTGRA